jgi:hypothetical protein
MCSCQGTNAGSKGRGHKLDATLRKAIHVHFERLLDGSQTFRDSMLHVTLGTVLV